jgi:phage terminase large subunit-like protein
MRDCSNDSLASRLGPRALAAAETPEDRQRLEFLWRFWARPAQLAPSGTWTTWLILAGRGFGKTRTGAEWIRARVESGKARRIALVGATAGDVRDVMVEGPAGLLAISPHWFRPLYEPSKRRLTWPNGAVATTFTADKPDRLRGPQHDTAWCDELAAWRYPDDAWDNLQFGLRLGDHPQACVTTTPRPIRLVKDLLKDAGTTVTRGSTYDNRSNLATAFLRKILAKYEGTRLGRQELRAEILEDTPGALWTLGLLDANRVREAPDLVRVVVAVDPQSADPKADPNENNAETGIVAAGVDAQGNGYVLRDASGQFSPAEWGERAVLLLDELAADCVVAEVNQGGAMVEHIVRTAAAQLHREGRRPSTHVAYRAVHASRGKATRAEPIAALDEQRRIRHVGTLASLEDQMCTWVPGQKSPDRMDARVWALTALMLQQFESDEGFSRAGRRR